LSVGHWGVPGTPQVFSGGTTQVTCVPSLVPPLSASMKLMPASSGSCTVMLVGPGVGLVPEGHSGVVCPCGTVHTRPKFGPLLQIPVGFWRQKLTSGCDCGLVIGWQTLGSALSVPHGVPSLAELAQKNPVSLSPLQLGSGVSVRPQ
jgi:hypothetical protein